MKKGEEATVLFSATDVCSDCVFIKSRHHHHHLLLPALLWLSAIPRLRLEAVYMMGVDDMSTQEIFRYFKAYPPAHIEWINDTSCEFYKDTEILSLSFFEPQD